MQHALAASLKALDSMSDEDVGDAFTGGFRDVVVEVHLFRNPQDEED
jgi:hypothetical protein